MGDGNWLSRGIRRKSGGKQDSQHSQAPVNRAALGIEQLEDRRVLATFLVTNFNDVDAGGATILGSLRWAIESANSDEARDTIVFSENAWTIPGSSRTISLNGGVLNITQPVDIMGSGARKLTVQQTRPNQRVFDINIGADDEIFGLQISGMTISGGNVVGQDQKGGGIYNRENLTMVEAVLTGNSAPIGGAIYNEFGRLTLERSTLDGNNAGRGGGITNGPDDPDEDGPIPSTYFRNSTARNNSAGLGGALFNNSGRMYIEHSTITENSATEGAGVASWGNPLPDAPGDPPPPPTVWTYATHSIIYGNEASGEEKGDFDRVGQNDEGVELLPSVFTREYNFVGTGNTTVDGDDWTFGAPPPVEDPPQDPPPEPTVDYVNIDPELGEYDDYGGSMDVYILLDTSPAIDAGNPELEDDDTFDQRGRHFKRYYDYDTEKEAIIDVGAVEMQFATFVVDTLIDETNGTYSELYTIEVILGIPVVTGNTTYDVEGNFSLREALQFATKNPGLDTIQFSNNLISADVLQTQDLTASRAPTILLKLGALRITEDTIIEGPSGFVLEVDASGNDPTPNNNNGDGSRVFMIDDSNALEQSEVSISNLTIMGADINGNGGGIFTRENLTLSQVTLKDNNASVNGGGVYVARGDSRIEGTTFNANRAAFGAGLYVDTAASASQANVAVVNATFSANLATSRGAAIYNNNSHLDIHFSTITLNNAGFTGSGVYIAGADALTEVWASAISANNLTDFNFDATSSLAAIESLGDNYIGRGNGNAAFVQGGDRRNVNNPMLAPLFNTGGLVETHRPLAGSPLIDTGPIIVAGSDPAAPEFDGRGVGFIRVFDGNLDGTVRADVGAYELQGLTLKVDNRLDENDGITSSGNFSLREAIALANENPLPDIIEFDPGLLALLDLISPEDPVLQLGNGTLKPGTLTPIWITDHLTINGPGQGFLALDGSLLEDPAQAIVGSRMFVIDNGNAATRIDVTVNGLEFRNALASQGGSVFYSKENLTLNQVTLINNRTYADLGNTFTDLHGGAVFQETGKLTVIDSLVTGNTTNDVAADGGAIYVLNGEFVLNGTIVAGNSTKATASEGGGIYVKNSAFTSNGSVITGNLTFGGASDGGGFFAEGGVVTLNETVVSGNTTVGSNSEGAGFATLNSAVTLNDTVVSVNDTIGNSASGPGAFINGGSLTANRSQFRENSAIGIATFGGGISSLGGTVTLNYTSVSENRLSGSGSHGAGVANIGGVLIVRNSTISGNVLSHAQSKGGGVYSDTNLTGSQSTSIINSTISGNIAPFRGGGVFNADGLTDIRHSTITNNKSDFLNVGSGVASQGNAVTQTRVLSSIIAGNVGSAAGTGSDVDSVDASFANSFVSLGYNVIGLGNSAGAFNQTSDKAGIANPLLAPLDSNGQAPNLLFELQTHALLPGSPAINAGSPSFNPNAFIPAMTTDERGEGFARVKNGRIDAGSFESDLVPALPADFNGNGVVDGADFLSWQRNFGKTGAIKADGDANGDGNVNAADLAAWKTGYGSVAGSEAAAAPAAAAASVPFATAALLAEEETTAPAASNSTVEAPVSGGSRFDSLASLGGPAAVAANSAVAQVVDESLRWNDFAAPKRRAASVFLADERSEELDLLFASSDDCEAGDAAFAAWGEELL